MSKVNKQELLDRITMDSKLMTGKPVIRGMRITVEQILDALASGTTITELIDDYPDLEEDDIKAAILYANELVKDERVYELNS